MLRAKIAAIEQQMQAKLAEIRATFEHAGVKGEHVEKESFEIFYASISHGDSRLVTGR